MCVCVCVCVCVQGIGSFLIFSLIQTWKTLLSVRERERERERERVCGSDLFKGARVAIRFP